MTMYPGVVWSDVRESEAALRQAATKRGLACGVSSLNSAGRRRYRVSDPATKATVAECCTENRPTAGECVAAIEYVLNAIGDTLPDEDAGPCRESSGELY